MEIQTVVEHPTHKFKIGFVTAHVALPTRAVVVAPMEPAYKLEQRQFFLIFSITLGVTPEKTVTICLVKCPAAQFTGEFALVPFDDASTVRAPGCILSWKHSRY